MSKMAEKNDLDASNNANKDISTLKKGEGNHEDKDEEMQGCGWFNFRPSCLRFCSSPRYLLVLLCAYFFANGAVVTGIFSTSISTIEKRFSLSSSKMGMVTSAFDVAALIFIGPVSYFGVRNKPAALGVGMIVMGIGYIVFMMPHFIEDTYQPVVGSTTPQPTNYTNNLLCAPKSSRAPATCNTKGGSDSAYGLFALGMFIAGAGCAPMISLGIPYMDESVSQNNSPIYLGLFQSSGIISIVIGFLLSSVFLQIFVHPGAAIKITPKSPSWIGAWWMGFAIGAVLAFIIGILLTALPKRFKGGSMRDDKEMNANKVTKKQEQEEHPGFKEIPRALKTLIIENPTFVFISMALSIQFFVISSSTAFLPKISLFQFRLTAAQASIYFGLSAGTGCFLGNIAGSWFIKYFKLSCLGMLKTSAVVSFLNVFFLMYTFIYCDNYPVPGINMQLKSSQGMNINNNCNSNCSCASGMFAPMCVNGLTYVNPCVAGCAQRTSALGFSNCTCLANSFGKMKTAKIGLCTSSCGGLPSLFFVMAWIASFSGFFMATPSMMATLRCVPFKLRSFAVGLQWMLVRVLGTIPGPILFGYLIDKTCVYWTKSCRSQGSCRIYDNKRLSINIGSLILGMNILVVMCILLALVSYKRKLKREESTTQQKNGTNGVELNTKL